MHQTPFCDSGYITSYSTMFAFLQARELYYKRGFEARHTYFKYYLNIQQPMYLFTMNLTPPKAELTDVAAS